MAVGKPIKKKPQPGKPPVVVQADVKWVIQHYDADGVEAGIQVTDATTIPRNAFKRTLKELADEIVAIKE